MCECSKRDQRATPTQTLALVATQLGDSLERASMPADIPDVCVSVPLQSLWQLCHIPAVCVFVFDIIKSILRLYFECVECKSSCMAHAAGSCWFQLISSQHESLQRLNCLQIGSPSQMLNFFYVRFILCVCVCVCLPVVWLKAKPILIIMFKDK